jgi:murein DD-endopeptidase MepM/ murein hydrolase activator NlpD
MVQSSRWQSRSLRVALLVLLASLALALSWDLASALSHAAAHRAKNRASGKSPKRVRARKITKRLRSKRVQAVDGRLIAIIWAPHIASSAALDRDSVAGIVPLTQEERSRLEQSLQDDMLPSDAPAPAAIVPEVPLVWPTAGPVGSPFGARRGGFHAGIDIIAPRYQPVHAAADGRVLYARPSRGRMGKVVVLQHADGMMTIYAHLARISVKEETTVDQGETIGAVGSTGRSTGPHLHFAVRVDGTTLNPQQFLPVSKESDLLQAARAQ